MATTKVNVSKISDFPKVTPVGTDYILVEKDGQGGSITLSQIPVSTPVSTRIAGEVNTLNSRIDNIVASSGDDISEIVDARQGSDGTNYASLRARLDAENNQLKGDLVDTQTHSHAHGKYIAINNALNARITNFAVESNKETVSVYFYKNLIDAFGWLNSIGQQYERCENGFITNLTDSNNKVYTNMYMFESTIPEITINAQLIDNDNTGAFIEFFDISGNQFRYRFDGSKTYKNINQFRINFSSYGTVTINNFHGNLGDVDLGYTEYESPQRATVNVVTQTGWENLKTFFPITNVLVSDDATISLSYISHELKYATPQMFGAKGDGVADDTLSFINALEVYDFLLIPNGNYKITKRINLKSYKSIVGLLPTVNDSVNIIFSSDDPNDVGILFGRYNNISNVTLIGAKGVGSGLILGDESNSCHMSSFRNIVISNFESGIYRGLNIAWNLVFESVKLTECNFGINFYDSEISCFSITFTNLYIDHCNKPLYAIGLSAVFNGCNFGIIKDLSFNCSTGCRMTFDNCNFECDEHISSGNEIFRAEGESFIFNNCTFRISAISTNTFISTGSNTACLRLEACSYGNAAIGENSLGNFFDRGCKGVDYGCIVIGKGCYSIIEPQPYDPYLPYISNENNNSPIMFKSSYIDTAKLKIGMILFECDSKTMCFYDGENIRSIATGEIIV